MEPCGTPGAILTQLECAAGITTLWFLLDNLSATEEVLCLFQIVLI